MYLTAKHAQTLAEEYGTPLYVYDSSGLRKRARTLLGLSLPYGHTVRYAVKANPHPEFIQLLDDMGVHFDASSSYEVDLLLELGIQGRCISLSSQQPAHDLSRLLMLGVHYVATSMYQLELFASVATPNSHVALRVNAGGGAGYNNRTTTAGVAASFGLWHEYLGDALAFAKAHNIIIDRLHMHAGSGADPKKWGETIGIALETVRRMPDVVTLDIGGGYKVSRVPSEPEADMQEVATIFRERLQAFAAETGRQLHLEIEPGTWLVAHSGILLSEIVDIVDTGSQGYTFLKVNTGMNDFMRPTLYGAQHTICAINGSREYASYVVVGHNCESGDILTPEPGDPEHIRPRQLQKAVIGDLIAIEDVGAYCASLRATGYNAFPSAKEVVLQSTETERVGDRALIKDFVADDH